MSDDLHDDPKPEQPTASPGRAIARVVAWTAASLGLLLIIVFAGLAWYSTTLDFQRRAGKEVEGVLEGATGGKVEI